MDQERIIVTGFSEGGLMAFNLGIRHPDVFRGVVPVAGEYQPDLAGPKGIHEARRPRFYILVGEDDPTVTSNRRALSDYMAAGIDVQLKVLPGLGHAFPPDAEAELQRAIRFVLGQ